MKKSKNSYLYSYENIEITITEAARESLEKIYDMVPNNSKIGFIYGHLSRTTGRWYVRAVNKNTL